MDYVRTGRAVPEGVRLRVPGADISVASLRLCPVFASLAPVPSPMRKSLGNLAPCSIDDLAGLVRTRLKRKQYRPDLLDGFVAETGLITMPP